MIGMCVCRSCGRTMEKEFIYCPWCGLSKINHEDKESQELVINQLEEKQALERERRVLELERTLDDLERDLDILVMSVEMAK